MSRQERSHRPPWAATWSPARIIVVAFAVVILLGGILLSLPISGRDGKPVGFLDALFTANSAVCVTGLVVVDTATAYSNFGQLVVMLLIQVGGLGIASAASIALLIGRRITLRERILLQESLGQETLQGIVRLTRYILLTTLVVEATGAMLLAWRFVPLWGWKRGLATAVFHAVSAFNNAGFDLMGGFRSLTGFATDPFVLLVIAGLLITGGIGFPVILDLHRWLSRRIGPLRRPAATTVLSAGSNGERHEGRLLLHTQVVLVVTAALLVVGTALILLLEWRNPATLGVLSLPDRLVNAFFQAATARTAGFNSLPIGSLTQGALVILVILMYIGASPASTGGGIKTSTFAAIALGLRATIRGSADVTVSERRLVRGVLDRAVAIAMLALGLVVTVSILLTVTERNRFSFLAVLFETTSAFGTVGLSTGITPELSPAGRLLIMLTMFTGRVGPLTFATALAARERAVSVHYPEDSVIIG
ncbi:MAG TPA: Trk family potassium uptake protein [Firmicutes bacterium]|nr:Trk family potassium uptake protein [Bacillota bacterium]